tara:strand:- start:4891 stop:6471 length:1581 start_codon:yes stop_codon:yes gene_type:complete
MSISDNSKYLALIPENGTEFIAGQKVIFTIKPNISFIKGRESYLSFDLENTSPNRISAHPLNVAGASSAIERMDIFSLENGQLLESLVDLNKWSAIENQYLHQDNTNLVVKEGCLEPLRSYVCSCNSGTKATAKVAEGVSYFETGSSRLSVIDTDGNSKFMATKFLVPLRSGIFNHFGVQEKLTPNLLFGGMRIELTLARNELVMSRIPASAGDGTTYKMDVLANGIDCGDTTGADTDVTTTKNFNNIQQSGLSIGQHIRVTSDHATTGTGTAVDTQKTITNLAITANKLVISFTGGLTMADNVRVSLPLASTTSYKLKNMEMKLLEVIPPQNMLKQVIKESQIDFISYETFKGNLPASSLSHQEDIPSVASKAKTLFTHYTDTTIENDPFTPNYYHGLSPKELNLNSVQYFIQNKLYPLRAYNPDHFDDKIVALNEINKGMRAIGKVVKAFGDASAGGINDYSYTYLTSRELARGEDFVYNLKDSEAQIRLGFSGARTNNVKVETFVFSVRSLMISKDAGISLVL